MNQPIVLKTGWVRTKREESEGNSWSEGFWGGTDGIACGLGVRKEEQAEEGRQAESSDFLPVLSRLPLTQLCSGLRWHLTER